MSKKSPRILGLMAGCTHPLWDPHYLAYFVCFNRHDYYEAHDVLEELWLAEGKTGSNYAFYKGLIQAAGAFVHMKLHRAEPHHRVHGQRLAPASRLLRLALDNTSHYGPRHQDLDLGPFHDICRAYFHKLAQDHFHSNPWSPESAPVLHGPAPLAQN